MSVLEKYAEDLALSFLDFTVRPMMKSRQLLELGILISITRMRWDKEVHELMGSIALYQIMSEWIHIGNFILYFFLLEVSL